MVGKYVGTRLQTIPSRTHLSMCVCALLDFAALGNGYRCLKQESGSRALSSLQYEDRFNKARERSQRASKAALHKQLNATQRQHPENLATRGTRRAGTKSKTLAHTKTYQRLWFFHAHADAASYVWWEHRCAV